MEQPLPTTPIAETPPQPKPEIKPAEGIKGKVQAWTEKGRAWFTRLRGKVDDKPKEVIEKIAEAPEKEDTISLSHERKLMQDKAKNSAIDSIDKPPVIEPAEKLKRHPSIAVVVPVYKEFENGNLIKMVDWLSKQTGENSVLAVFVVNNTNSLDDNQSALFDNEYSMNLIKYLQGDTSIDLSLFNFNKETQEIVSRVKKDNINIDLIDLSSQGKALKKRSIGTVRQTGLSVAIEKLESYGLGEDGIIAMLDCDSIPEKQFVTKVRQQFDNPDLDTLFIGIDHVIAPDTSDDLIKTFPLSQYELVDERFTQLLTGEVIISGPQIIARARAYKQVGGVPLVDKGEDRMLGLALASKTKAKYESAIVTYTQDRARLESYDGAERLAKLDAGYLMLEKGKLNPNIVLCQSHLQRLIKQGKDLSPDELTAMLTKYNLITNAVKTADYLNGLQSKEAPAEVVNSANVSDTLTVKLANNILEYAVSQGIRRVCTFNQYVQGMTDFFILHISEEEKTILTQRINEAVRKHNVWRAIKRNVIREYINIRKQGREPEGQLKSFIEHNSWLNSKFDVNKNPNEIIDEVSTEYSEVLQPLDQTKYAQYMVKYLALTDFLMETHFNPEQYPSTNMCLS